MDAADGQEKAQLGMYTQCPECGSAFRVTADVLRQAAGRVRCGGCGSPFNALDYLSEQKPVTAVPPPPEDEPAEAAQEPPELEADEPPETISAERSAALLKTLDELAGSDIRIEDTGIEWRVIDEDDESGPVRDDIDDDTGSMRWFIDESPTPVDEQLSAEPGEVDAPEIFEPTAATPGTEEMRFDDDTPLPEDFDFDAGPAASEPPPAVEAREEPSEDEIGQVDLALGDPEDWEDLLGEVDDEEHRGEQLASVAERDDEEDEEPLPDVDTQFATQAEAMGIDLSGMYQRAEVSDDEPVEESTIDDDLIAAAFETEARARAEEQADSDALEVDDGDELEEIDDLEEFEDIDDLGEIADIEDVEEIEDIEFEIEEADSLFEPRDRELVASTKEDTILAAELGLDLSDDDADEETGAGSSADDEQQPVVPPLTEEEQTINMMIDQDLLAIAVEDEDGFASTIVQKQRSEPGEAAAEEPKEAAEDEDDDKAVEEDEELAAADSPLVETIIMEGEFIRDAAEEEELEAARQKTGDPNLASAAAAGIEIAKKEDQPEPNQPLDYRLVAGIAGLALLLAGQFVHQSRESLAVYPAFNDSVGSVYRMLGKPVTPAWDIAGWRFEATKGSTDESDEVLTIYSRIGNKSGEALPYPLINVSLTDRFEDIIGSKVLEPGDYLAENLDTRQPVAPGETFSAVISIEAPAANATGFKLNVCYRQPGGRLRCAIDDFK